MDDIDAMLAELVGEVSPTEQVATAPEPSDMAQLVEEHHETPQVEPVALRGHPIAQVVAEAAPPVQRFQRVEKACLGCGLVESYHPAVGFPCCGPCLERLGEMTWDERMQIQSHRRTIEQVLAGRGMAKFGDVKDRVHAPMMFENAKPNEDVTRWAARPTTTLVLQGLPGRGKSYQAVGAMRALLSRRHGEGYLINCAGLGRMGRDEFRIWSDSAVLALDDFGARLTPACLASAYELIEARIGQMRPLIVTTNITPGGIMELDPRIGSRLGAAQWVAMTGNDRRLQA